MKKKKKRPARFPLAIALVFFHRTLSDSQPGSDGDALGSEDPLPRHIPPVGGVSQGQEQRPIMRRC